MNNANLCFLDVCLVWSQYLLFTGKTEPLQHYANLHGKTAKSLSGRPFGGFPNESQFYEIRPENVHTDSVKFEKPIN